MQSRETSKDTLAQRSRYASEGCVSKTIVAADAVSQGLTDGRVRAVAEAYHVTLVVPFCLAAARSFFMHLGICSNVGARPRKVASSLSPNFNLPAQAGRRLKAFFCRERFARPRQARANLLEGRRNRPHCARRGRLSFRSRSVAGNIFPVHDSRDRFRGSPAIQHPRTNGRSMC